MRQGRFTPFSERSERAKGARRVKKRHSAAFLAKAGQSYAEARDCLPRQSGLPNSRKTFWEKYSMGMGARPRTHPPQAPLPYDFFVCKAHKK